MQACAAHTNGRERAALLRLSCCTNGKNTPEGRNFNHRKTAVFGRFLRVFAGFFHALFDPLTA
jgi:hypothetical protein